MKFKELLLLLAFIFFSSCISSRAKRFKLDIERIYHKVTNPIATDKFKNELEDFVNSDTTTFAYKDKVISTAIILKILDTLVIPNKEIEERWGFVGPPFEFIPEENNIRKYALIKHGVSYGWNQAMHSNCYYYSLKPPQIIQIKKALKRLKLFQGKIDPIWTKEIIKGIKIYEVIYTDNNSFRMISSKNKSIEQYTLYQMGIIKKKEMKPSGFNIPRHILWPMVEKELNKRGYNDQKTTVAKLVSYSKDNQIDKENSLDILKSLGIKVDYKYSKKCSH